MFVQYSFVDRRYTVARADRTPFEMNNSMIFLTGLGCMILTAGAYLLA